MNDYAEPFGGAEVAQEVLRDALRRRGHEVRIFAARPLMEGGQSLADYVCFGTVSRFRTLLQAFNPWAAFALRRTIAEFHPDVVHVRVFLTQLPPAPAKCPEPSSCDLVSLDVSARHQNPAGWNSLPRTSGHCLLPPRLPAAARLASDAGPSEPIEQMGGCVSPQRRQ